MGFSLKWGEVVAISWKLGEANEIWQTILWSAVKTPEINLFMIPKSPTIIGHSQKLIKHWKVATFNEQE